MNHRRQIIRAIASTSACGFLSLAGAGRVLAATQGAWPLVAAASSSRFALEDIVSAFERDTGQSVRLSYGSSGNLSRQIRQGAPFELFLSADEDFARDLTRAGFTLERGVPYALGKLAIFAPKGSPLRPDSNLSGLKTALERGEIQRFAIANPEHAPYGRAAREALEHSGLWGAIKPHLVLGENVSQAAQFAVSGSCEGAMIASSLVRAPGFAGRGSARTLSPGSYRPLRQHMVLLTGAGAIAHAFYQFLQGAAARKIFDAHGFGRTEAE